MVVMLVMNLNCVPVKHYQYPSESSILHDQKNNFQPFFNEYAPDSEHKDACSLLLVKHSKPLHIQLHELMY